MIKLIVRNLLIFYCFMLIDKPVVLIPAINKDVPYLLPNTRYNVRALVSAVPPATSQGWLWQPCGELPSCKQNSNSWRNVTSNNYQRFNQSGHLKYYATNSKGTGEYVMKIKVAGILCLKTSFLFFCIMLLLTYLMFVIIMIIM